MSKLSFSPLHVNGMTINNTFSLIKSSVDLAIPVRTNLGVMLDAALTKMITDNESFGQQINKNQKSELTDNLKPLDKDRDVTQAEINRTITFYSKGRDEIKKVAAQKLKLFFTPYWNAAELPQNTQTGVIAEMIGKYKANTELVAAAQTLGIIDLIAALETKNNAFVAVYKSRNDEVAGRETSGSSLKPAAVASYNNFCTVLEQAVNLMPNDTNLALFNHLDLLRKKYHAMGGSKDAPAPDGAPAK